MCASVHCHLLVCVSDLANIASNLGMDMCKCPPRNLVEGSSCGLSMKALNTPLPTWRRKNINLRHNSRSPKLKSNSWSHGRGLTFVCERNFIETARHAQNFGSYPCTEPSVYIAFWCATASVTPPPELIYEATAVLRFDNCHAALFSFKDYCSRDAPTV